MRVLITGANGFVGKNLGLYLSERSDVQTVSFTRDNSVEELSDLLPDIDFIFHLAGVNRPKNDSEFYKGNVGFTEQLVRKVIETNCKAPIIYTSSIQACLDNPYGISKSSAEQCLLKLKDDYNYPVSIFRLPNVFGKWAKPNYNSAVATFCHNIANDLPISIHDPEAVIKLVYVDDVVKQFVSVMDQKVDFEAFGSVNPVHEICVGNLTNQLYKFKEGRTSLFTESVGVGFTRSLYSTYLSFMPKRKFSYEIPKHGDDRGVFVEMLKTRDSGQFSFFTAHPGVTRGGHYHHTKTEKFLVIKGGACFKFRHMDTGERHEIVTTGEEARIVETVPGWTHDITNIGDEELVVMLWANEVFDRDNPDTYACLLSGEL